MKITLCGSTRFMEAFGDWNVILTRAGHVVYTVCTSFKGNLQMGGTVAMLESDPSVGDELEIKRRFDLIHLQKITESDAIVVLNVGGYFGDSTRREIEWARMLRKQVFWLEHTQIGAAPLGTSVWQLYNCFDDKPIRSVPGTEKYGSSATPSR